ncbi:MULTISPECIES: TetR/AcrR family transcriptional regulator [Pedobacter]|jgi:Transcriptional regulator|uniref:TetR/AcrR family transcriptional regulator n=1 Tax=Pedobacter panaciterrae TaxID=363849 RepID=A0ABU8NL60_9SPHI|nr:MULTISPECIES: TetR/AcrR family transcriptional regulator [Pedobacter]ETZ20624.1 TetR family transcriptional regulator [Pedobacter sp. V48]NQX52583.1 TetR/AcrR family transcriptional regulator [Pedobacter panaciterrae]
MGIAERKIRQKEEFRASILEAAWLQVLTDGWQSLSIRKIADAIEYSIPVIYNHFENKEAILLEFTKEGFQKLADALLEVKNKYTEPSEQLEAIAHAYWDFAFEHKEYYQLMFGLGIPACEMVNQIAEMKYMTGIMITTIQEAIASSNNTETNYFLKYHTYLSILHGLVSIEMIQKVGKPDPEKKLILQDAISGFIKSLTIK